MSYPSALDSWATMSGSDTLSAAGHTARHNAVQAAVVALETKLGVDSSAVSTTHDYKLSGVTGSDKAVSKTGSETLTNKTLTSPVVNTPTFSASAINTADIAALAVTGAKIANATVTPAKLSLGVLSATVATEETTTGTSYTDLATDGPTITYDPGATQTVLILFGSYIANSAIGNTTYVSVNISGATTLAATDSNSLRLRPSGTNGQEVISGTFSLITTLNSGSNSIRLKYRTEAGTGTFGARFVIMIPLG